MTDAPAAALSADLTAAPALAGRSVAVVGGGIAGLTATLALRQRGAAVTVHERAGALREVGAGIQISPNAGRVLEALGLGDAFAAISQPIERTLLHDAGGGTVAWLNFARHRPHDRFRAVHRARLVALLEEAAREAGVTVRLGETVTDPPAADLVIGADGLHSRQRAALNGAETPFFTGQTAWRALIPDADETPQVDVFMGAGRHLVSYPLGDGIRNIVAVLETRDWTAEGWSQPGDPAALRAAFAGFGGPVPRWLAQVEACGWWGLHRHPVARRWQDGSRVLIGDAAHPTLPFLAQGACMAIEDAFRLARHLEAAPQAQALAAFEAERIPRTTRIVAAASANARNYHLTGVKRAAAHAALRLASAVATGPLLNRFAWVYDYDPTTPVPSP